MGVRVIRAFDRGSYEQERFNEANLDLTTTALRVNRMMVTLAPLKWLADQFYHNCHHLVWC